MADGKELAHRAEGHLATSTALGDTAAMLSMIRDLALDPNVDAAKFATIAEVAERAQDRSQRQQFYEDKAKALIEMPVIDKRGKITIADKSAPNDPSRARTQGTFAKWPDLQRAIAPVLARYNLFLTHEIGHEGQTTHCTPVLSHKNGFVERGGTMQLPLDTSGGKNNTQGAGSAASYGKRHTTVAHLGLRLEDSDDDGALMATEDEPLNDQQARRVAEGEARAAEGPDSYRAWFAKIDPKDRAWMIQTGRHAKLGNGELEPKKLASPPSPPPPADRGRPAERDVSTPEGWTDQYVEDCAAARDTDALDRLMARGAKALAKIDGQGLTKLYDRALYAQDEARDRLRDGGLFGGDE
jgi:hypothetical protein